LAVKAPDLCAATGVSEDISNHGELVQAVLDRFGAGSVGPESGFDQTQALLANTGRCALLGPSDPMTRILIRKSRENVRMFRVERNDRGLNLVFNELLRECINDELANVAVDEHRIARHERL
jgi:hypothetical protein